MKLVSPATARHRFKVEGFKDGKILVAFASSAPGQHNFDIRDDCEHVRYTVDNVSWVWDGKTWVDGETFKFPKKTVAKKTDPKTPVRTDPEKLIKERRDAVEKSFRKVTKKL